MYDLRDPETQRQCAERAAAQKVEARPLVRSPYPASPYPASPPAPAPTLSPDETPCVPTWMAFKRRGRPKGRRLRYPFATMARHTTFKVAPDDQQPKWASFRIYCSKMGAKYGRTFQCYKLEDGTFEVWREF